MHAAIPLGDAVFAQQKCVLWIVLTDQDGSVVRQVAPDKRPGPYLISSHPDWWNLNRTSWKEPKFGNAWVSPMPSNEVVARIDMRVRNAAGDQFTLGAFDGADHGKHRPVTRIGFVSQFGNISLQVPLSDIEGTTGMTGK